MGSLSSYPQVTSLLSAYRVPLVTNPGVAGGNGWISGSDLSASVRAAASSMRPTGTLAESFPRHAATFSVIAGSGALNLAALGLTAGQVVTSLSFYASATALDTPTHWWFALYDSALNLIRQSADQLTAAWPATTKKTLALSSSYTVPTTGLYYAGICVVANTGFGLVGSGNMGQAVAADPPIIYGRANTGLTGTAPATATGLAPVLTGIFYATAS